MFKTNVKDEVEAQELKDLVEGPVDGIMNNLVTAVSLLRSDILFRQTETETILVFAGKAHEIFREDIKECVHASAEALQALGLGE
jgi:hypothetical protein